MGLRRVFDEAGGGHPLQTITERFDAAGRGERCGGGERVGWFWAGSGAVVSDRAAGGDSRAVRVVGSRSRFVTDLVTGE